MFRFLKYISVKLDDDSMGSDHFPIGINFFIGKTKPISISQISLERLRIMILIELTGAKSRSS